MGMPSEGAVRSWLAAHKLGACFEQGQPTPVDSHQLETQVQSDFTMLAATVVVRPQETVLLALLGARDMYLQSNAEATDLQQRSVHLFPEVFGLFITNGGLHSVEAAVIAHAIPWTLGHQLQRLWKLDGYVFVVNQSALACVSHS
jgi:hypothetical protein